MFFSSSLRDEPLPAKAVAPPEKSVTPAKSLASIEETPPRKRKKGEEDEEEVEEEGEAEVEDQQEEATTKPLMRTASKESLEGANGI
jgi:hypothetical protein